jgi:two-component system response regulator
MTQHQPAPPEANAPAKAILLVEDNPDDVMLTLRAFQKNNLHGLVQVVRDGAEALDYLFATGAFAGRDTAHQPRLILLDLNLPKLNGLEVLDRIRADRRTRFLPVIAFTASVAERDIISSYMGGANSCVIKPAEFAGFAETLRQIWHYWSATNFVPPVPAADSATRTEAQS